MSSSTGRIRARRATPSSHEHRRRKNGGTVERTLASLAERWNETALPLTFHRSTVLLFHRSTYLELWVSLADIPVHDQRSRDRREFAHIGAGDGGRSRPRTDLTRPACTPARRPRSTNR